MIELLCFVLAALTSPFKSSCGLKLRTRFHHVINSDEVFGTHNISDRNDRGQNHSTDR
jgi:hypothetical protein